MPKRRLSDEQIDVMAGLRERGWSLARISEYFAERGTVVSAGSIAWQCLRVGADVPLRLQGSTFQPTEDYVRNGHTVRPYSAADDALLLALDCQNFPIAVIARRMDRKANSIRGRLMTLARREARAEQREAA